MVGGLAGAVVGAGRLMAPRADPEPSPQKAVEGESDDEPPDPPQNGKVGPLRREKGKHLRVSGKSGRSEEHTSELQSLMRISYAVFSLKKNHTTLYTQ